MKANDVHHQLWLIYSQLKEAEGDTLNRLDLLQRSRIELGQVLNTMNRQLFPYLYIEDSARAEQNLIRNRTE